MSTRGKKKKRKEMIDSLTWAAQAAFVVFAFTSAERMFIHKPSSVERFQNIHGVALIPCLCDHSAVADHLIEINLCLTAPSTSFRTKREFEIEKGLQPRPIANEQVFTEFKRFCSLISYVLGRYRQFADESRHLLKEEREYLDSSIKPQLERSIQTLERFCVTDGHVSYLHEQCDLLMEILAKLVSIMSKTI